MSENTTPRMTDERMAEIASIFGRHDQDSPAVGVAFHELLAEVHRTRTYSDEVRAAMERYAKHLAAVEAGTLEKSPYAIYSPKMGAWIAGLDDVEDQATLATAFVALALPGKDGG
jgi:hypothetical protein